MSTVTELSNRKLRSPANRFGDLFYEIPEPEVFDLPEGRGKISSFCLVNMGQLGGTRYVINVIPRDLVEAALTEYTVSDGMTFSVEVIAHERSGKALVIAHYDKIIGSIWLAYVDPESVPKL